MGVLAKCLGSIFVLCAGVSARATNGDVASFYGGKTLSIVSPFDANGNYSQAAKVLAAFLPKYLPGHPVGVVQFMPGAGGLQATNYMANNAPRDGTVISILYDSMPSTQVTNPTEVHFDATTFNILGSLNKGDFGLIAVMKTSGVTNIEGAKQHELYFGAPGTGSAEYYIPYSMNKLIGTQFKIIPGYKSQTEEFLDMERGELQGVFTNYQSLLGARPDWMSGGHLNFLAQIGDERSSIFPDVPLAQETTDNPSDKEIFEFFALSRVPGRMFFAPSGVPADRLDALREAFSAAVKDPELCNLLLKQKIDCDPRDWRTAQDIVARTIQASPQSVARLKKLIDGGN